MLKDSNRKSKKLEVILFTAEKLFLSKGVRSITVEEITREAKVSKATFYKYFADKQDIIKHVLEKVFETNFKKLETVVESGKRHKLTYESFMSVFDMDEYEEFFQSGFIEELREDYPEMVTLYTQWVKEIRLPKYQELMRMAKVDGLIRVDIDTDFLIQYTLAMRHAMIRSLQGSPYYTKEDNLKEFIRQFYDLYLNGVVNKPGS
ncbi:TetR/AcrR family transcriptional regulator [Alteribacter keqinensis]|uniref:TetR/AcrR family transcriptional regulator n=1 Tax=Alteribacter keqinensis TaxID=2483800 RepID=A0A3M7TQG1_9BACI|nr:TetR/AcrR family transcriptional regulator [Alteribacter keqinensis]RNA66929.1 TetR/AcrR family transcriptional regulator [Alteribacter keqinensis]